MTPNGDGISDHGDLMECLGDGCDFTLRIGKYETVDHVFCPECVSHVVRPNHPDIRARHLKKEEMKRKEDALKRAEKLEEEARLLRKEAAK